MTLEKAVMIHDGIQRCLVEKIYVNGTPLIAASAIAKDVCRKEVLTALQLCVAEMYFVLKSNEASKDEWAQYATYCNGAEGNLYNLFCSCADDEDLVKVRSMPKGSMESMAEWRRLSEVLRKERSLPPRSIGEVTDLVKRLPLDETFWKGIYLFLKLPLSDCPPPRKYFTRPPTSTKGKGSGCLVTIASLAGLGAALCCGILYFAR